MEAVSIEVASVEGASFELPLSGFPSTRAAPLVLLGKFVHRVCVLDRFYSFGLRTFGFSDNGHFGLRIGVHPGPGIVQSSSSLRGRNLDLDTRGRYLPEGGDVRVLDLYVSVDVRTMVSRD